MHFGGRYINLIAACLSSRCTVTPSLLKVSRFLSSNATAGEEKDTERVKSPHPLSYYNNLGIRQRKVNQLFRKCADGEEGSLVKRLGKFLRILSVYDFTQDDVRQLIMKKPRIFDMSSNQLQKRIDKMIQYGYLEDSLKKVIMKFPNLLVYDEKKGTLAARLKTLQEIDLFPKLDGDSALYLAQKCPALLSITDKSTFDSRIHNLMRYGLNDQEIYRLVMKYPTILTSLEKTVNEKLDYIINVLGVQPYMVIKCPDVFNHSIRRIKERHQYLVRERLFKTGSQRKFTESMLRALIITSDKTFAEHVTKTALEDFRSFQTQMWASEETKSKDTTAPSGKDEECSEPENIVDHLEESTYIEINDESDNMNVDNDNDVDARPYRQDYLTSFGSNRREMLPSDEKWYNSPFPEIQPPQPIQRKQVRKSKRKSDRR